MRRQYPLDVHGYLNQSYKTVVLKDKVTIQTFKLLYIIPEFILIAIKSLSNCKQPLYRETV